MLPCAAGYYRYVLARMQEGKTDISAEKANYEFSSLSAVAITPSAQVLPDILVTKVGICGRLAYGDLHFKKNSKRVTLTAVDGSGVNMQAIADDFNKFCFMVPPGRYRIAPYVSTDDKAKGLVVAPTHVDLAVAGEPVLELMFGQAKLALHGNVYCLDGPCPDDVMIVVHVESTGTKVMSGKLGDLQADHASTGKKPPPAWLPPQQCTVNCACSPITPAVCDLPVLTHRKCRRYGHALKLHATCLSLSSKLGVPSVPAGPVISLGLG